MILERNVNLIIFYNLYKLVLILTYSRRIAEQRFRWRGVTCPCLFSMSTFSVREQNISYFVLKLHLTKTFNKSFKTTSFLTFLLQLILINKLYRNEPLPWYNMKQGWFSALQLSSHVDNLRCTVQWVLIYAICMALESCTIDSVEF